MDDFARFFEHSVDLNGIANAEGYFRRVNNAWERTLGWTSAEISASPWLDFVHPEDRQATLDAGRRLFEGVSIISFENRYRCKDGSYRLIQWHSEMVNGEAYCSGRDVTEERARLVRRANQEKADDLRGRGPGFFAIFDSAPFAMALTKMPEGVTVSVNAAFLKLFEFALDEVVGRTSLDLRLADPASRARIGEELRDRGVVRDFECARRTKSGARVVLLLNVDPINVDGEAYVLTSVRDITKASAAAAELRALVDNLPELAWTARPDGFIDFYNRRCYEYTGTTYEDMQGWGWQSVHDPHELPRVMEVWTRSITTRQPFDQTFPLRRKDGAYRWFLTRVAPMFDDAGELVRWVGINTDVDDRQRAQDALREAEERFRVALEGAPTGMIMVNERGTIALVNANVEALFGYGREELVGKSIEMLIPERFRGSHPGLRAGFFADPQARSMGVGRDLFGLRKDGSEVPIEIGLNPLRTSEGAFVLSSVVDISERTRAEERFRLALEGAPTGMIMVNERGTIALVNANVEALFGYGREELVGKSIEMLIPERFRGNHPGLRAGFLADPRFRSMGAKRDLYGLRKDGSEVPIEVGLNPLRTSEGDFVLSSVVDISERQRVQAELREMAAVVESADNAILTIGLDGRIRSWNPGATRLLGYRAEEIVGLPVKRLIPQDLWDEETQIIARIQAGKRDVQMETLRMKKDGTLVAVSLTISPILDRNGHVVGAAKIMRDVTERNKAEQERAQLVEQLQTMNAELEERVRSRTSELSETLREREALLREKTSLLQEVHHRVKNNLQVIGSLISLQADVAHDEKVTVVFEDMRSRIHAIALLHERLYRSTDLGAIDLADYLEGLVADIARTAGGGSARVTTEGPLIYIDMDRAVPVGLITNELMTNAFKYGGRGAAPSKVEVHLARTGDLARLSVTDDGAGFPAGVEPSGDGTLGVFLVRALAGQLKGTLRFSSAPTRCTLEFPVGERRP